MSLIDQRNFNYRENTQSETIHVSDVIQARMTHPVHSRPRRATPVANQLDLFGDTLPLPGPTLTDAAPAPLEAPLIPPLDLAAASAESGRQAPQEPLAAIGNLAGVLVRLEGLEAPIRKIADMRSAVKMTVKIIGRGAEDIPADPPSLRALLALANPAVIRMSRARWGAVQSLLRAALMQAGVQVMPARDTTRLTPEWEALSRLLTERRLRFGLSRVISYLSREGIAPDQVRDTHLRQFREALFSTSLEPSPQVVANTTARLWNEAVRITAGWPACQAEVRPDPHRYSLKWDVFAPSFRADVEAFLTHGGNQDPLADDYAPSVKQSTSESRKKCLKQLASLLVASGHPLAELTSLEVLTRPVSVKAALSQLMKRNDGKVTPQIEILSQLMLTVARYWVKAPPADIEVLRKFTAAVRLKKAGMKPKNRERLRQFDNHANRDALLDLPARVLAETRRDDDGGKSAAVRVMMALAIELLTMAPMRAGNLVALEVDRHIVRIRRGGKSTFHIVIPEAETKTGAPFEAELPPESAALLTTYLDKYRSRIAQPTGPYLFPGRGGALRPVDSFSLLLKKFIRRETGLVMHPHLFRHLVGKLHLEKNPHDIETVRQVLGHTSTRTTLRAYAELSGEAAYRRYDGTIADLRAEAQAMLERPKRKPKRGR